MKFARYLDQFLTKRGRLIISLVLVIAILITLDAYARGRFESEVMTSSEHFELSGLATQQAQEVLNEMESSYDRIGRDLKAQPEALIRVYVYNNRWAYGRATGHWGASGNIEGSKMIHILWVGEETGQVAIHEFAHTVTLQLLIEHELQPLDAAKFDEKFASLPVWLWEGVAVYEANQAHNPMSFPYMKNGQYPSLQELSQTSKGAKIYDVGYTLVEFIESKWGHDRLIQLILEYGNAQKVLGVSDEQLSRLWSDFVRVKYQ